MQPETGVFQINQINFAEEQSIIEHLLPPHEDADVEAFGVLKMLQSVPLALQREVLDLSSVWLLFDEAERKFPSLDHGGKYPEKDAAIKKQFVLNAVFRKLPRAEKVICQLWRN